jgi:hypothetical protein
MEAATTPTNPDPSFSTRPLRRLNEGSAAASVCGSCQRPCGQAHSAGSESGTRSAARVGRGTPQFPRMLGVAGAPRRRDRNGGGRRGYLGVWKGRFGGGEGVRVAGGFPGGLGGAGSVASYRTMVPLSVSANRPIIYLFMF